MLKKQKGITLIALVITIIVLLILAGVTIAMVVGDNGILTRSREAKDTTNIKKIQEEVDLEAADLVAEYHTKDSGEVTGSAGDYVAAQIDGKTINGIEIDADGAEMTITAEKDGVRTTGTIQDDGSILWDDENSTVAGGGSGGGSETPTTSPSPSPTTPATSTVDEDMYGDYVDIGVDINGDSNTTNDFRVFLNDGSNVYLIAADYIPNSMCPKSNQTTADNGTHSLNTNGSYQAYFTNILGDYNGATDISGNSLLNSNYNKWANRTDLGDYASIKNAKAVAYMLDTTAWGVKFKNSSNSSYINYVTGGPTLEQFKESFNQIHTTTADQIFYSENENTGYCVKKGSAPGTSDYSAQFSTADNNLYFITADTKASCAWLASPSAGSQINVMRADCNGIVNFHYYSNNNAGFRPLVCLKSEVKLVEPETEGGAYTLQ